MSQVCQAVLLPLLRKADTVSQPVKAWKNQMPLVLTGPITWYRSWTPIHRRLTPCPNATHSCWRPRSLRDGKMHNAITRMGGIFWYTFSMLFSTPDTTRIHWKTFSIYFLGVKPFFHRLTHLFLNIFNLFIDIFKISIIIPIHFMEDYFKSNPIYLFNYLSYLFIYWSNQLTETGLLIRPSNLGYTYAKPSKLFWVTTEICMHMKI